MKTKNRLVFLKLGGSLITDKSKPYTANFAVIKNLALQIKSALETDPNLQLIIGNGSGSFAHYPAATYEMGKGIKNENQKMGFCLVQDAASQLNRIVVKSLLDVGVKAVSVNPSSMITAENFVIKNIFIDPLIGYINTGLTPVFYGDIVFDSKMGSAIFSTEKLITAFALEFKKRNIPVSGIIQNGATKGVLNISGEVIPSISKGNYENIKKVFFDTSGYDVTGGMSHKINESLTLASFGIKTTVINGVHQKDILKDALLQRPVFGTVIS